MYKSPITIYQNQMEKKVENEIFKAIKSFHVDIDKEELLKALKYDRAQYQQGYEDARAEGMQTAEWLINPDGYFPYCSRCLKEPEGHFLTPFCPYCGARMVKARGRSKRLCE